MRQPLAWAGLMLPVTLAIPSAIYSSPWLRDSAIPPLTSSTFEPRDLDAAHQAVTYALRDLISAHNKITPRDIPVNRLHGVLAGVKRRADRVEQEFGTAVATCAKIGGKKEEDISAQAFVYYDDHEFGFDIDKRDASTSISVLKRVEKTYTAGSESADNDGSTLCSTTKGPYNAVDNAQACCYIHWGWIQHMHYDDTIEQYSFPDPLATTGVDSEVAAYVVCFDYVAGTSCSSALLSHRSECESAKILWENNQPTPPAAMM